MSDPSIDFDAAGRAAALATVAAILAGPRAGLVERFIEGRASCMRQAVADMRAAGADDDDIADWVEAFLFTLAKALERRLAGRLENVLAENVFGGCN